MTISITWPTAQEVEVVDAIRDAIGRNITFYVVASAIPCSICSLDPITNTSTDSFCVVCSGLYWINTYSGVDVMAHITWAHSEQLAWTTGGQLDLGDCRAQIKYTQANLENIDNAKWVDVDGKKMTIFKKILRGVQDINRILLDLKESEE